MAAQIGLALASTSTAGTTPPVSGAEVIPLHIVAPTVPVPTLVDGRPA